jgi:hypothetical protein
MMNFLNRSLQILILISTKRKKKNGKNTKNIGHTIPEIFSQNLRRGIDIKRKERKIMKTMNKNLKIQNKWQNKKKSSIKKESNNGNTRKRNGCKERRK